MGVAGRATRVIYRVGFPRGLLSTGCRISPQSGMLLSSFLGKTVQAFVAANLAGLFQVTQFVADS